ncbi:MAG: HAD-IA family hydrolase, partial [Ectothiorhodospiraceae bacterium]
KLERTALHEHVEAVISSHDFGYSKEHPAFWKSLRAVEPFEPARTLLLDDSPGCLRAGRNAGIHQTVGIARPDTTGPERAPHEFPTLTDFASVMP